MKTRVAGQVKEMTRAVFASGGAARRVTRAVAHINGSDVEIVKFVPPMSVSAPASANGVEYENGLSSVYSNYVTAIPAGGSPPYRYSWSIISGSASIESQTSATTRFYALLGRGQSSNSVAKVVVTDIYGTTAQTTVSVFLRNEGS